ncbi:MAG: NAD(P)-dependent oxidoreductase [Azospirillaceae bacterium]|nr:NAD(P)-dependent oxidoreductase [Azospirillaceae bacterium]
MIDPTPDRPVALIPISIDLIRVPTGIVGNGATALRRFQQVAQAGATALVFATAPEADLATAAGPWLRRREPGDGDLDGLRLLYITGLDPAAAARLAAHARDRGLLVNVEDVPTLCDFHSAAVVRRGDMVIAISTGGRSPGLAARLRRYLEAAIPADWARHLDEAAALRRLWRAGGANMATVAARTDRLAESRGWLPALAGRRAKPRTR